MVFTNVTLLHCAQNLRQYQFARELVFGLRAFPHANEKFSGLTPHVAEHPELVTQIERLNRIRDCTEVNTPCQGIFATALLLREVMQHVFPNCIRDGVHPGWPWSQLVDQSEGGVRTVWPAAGQPVSRGCLVRDSHVAGPDCSV